MRANGKHSAVQSGGAVWLEAGERWKEHLESPGGQRTTVPQDGTDRVQGSKGSLNARWRREPGGGDTDQPEADNFRGSAQTADREKLNDERGASPCQ